MREVSWVCQSVNSNTRAFLVAGVQRAGNCGLSHTSPCSSCRRHAGNLWGHQSACLSLCNPAGNGCCGQTRNPGFPQQLVVRGLLPWLWPQLKCQENWALSYLVLFSNLNSNWPPGLPSSDDGSSALCQVRTPATLAPSFALPSTSLWAPWGRDFYLFCYCRVLSV